MRIRIVVTVLALLYCMFAGVEAAPAEPLQKYSWEVGPELSYIAYEEPHFAEFRGILAGIAGGFAYHNGLMLGAEGRLAFGSLNYSSPESGTMDGVFDYIAEFRGLGGYDFTLDAGPVLTPYTGFGYRYLNDNSAGMVTSLGASGYERESNYFYSPVGLKCRVPAETGWAIDAAAEYDVFWKGKQVTHLGDVVPGQEDLVNSQKHGYGMRGSIAIAAKAGSMEYSIGPFLRYWKVKDSEPAYFFDATGLLCGSQICIGLEPANHSTEYGISFQARF